MAGKIRLAFENKLNFALSELLNQMGVVSRSEYLNKGRRDVVIYHQGLAIILEGSYSREDAEKDAKRRIEQLNTDIAVAIHYPTAFPQSLTEPEIKEKLAESKLPIKVIVPEDISGSLFELLHNRRVIAKPLEEWHELDLNSLATLIREVGQFVISEEEINKVEGEVEALIQRFVETLSYHDQSDIIARNLYDILHRRMDFQSEAQRIFRKRSLLNRP